MAIITISPFDTSATGTADADIIVAQELNDATTDTISGGGGDDLIIGDSAGIFLDSAVSNTSILTAMSIDN